MDQSTDLNAALKFVIDRIKEQAVKSGDPLTHEQLSLLHYLPKATHAAITAGSYPTSPLPRNTNYERLCALAKTAYSEASKKDPEKLKWEFASAVFLFHNDPMWGVLHYAGVRNQRPGWDTVLLVFWAATLIAILMAIALALFASSDNFAAAKWTVLCIVAIALGFLTRWGARRTERLRFEHEIARCRAGFSPTHDKAN